MLRNCKMLAGAMVFGFGYLCGTWNAGMPQNLSAVQQQKPVEEISSDTLTAYQKFRKGSNDLSDSLAGESLQVSAVEGLNFFALSVGGIDAVRDLEEGRGVDPETLAAIYADRASPEISQHVDTDPQGRRRYKGTVIRMYSKERLKEVFQRRDQMEIRGARLGG